MRSQTTNLFAATTKLRCRSVPIAVLEDKERKRCFFNLTGKVLLLLNKANHQAYFCTMIENAEPDLSSVEIQTKNKDI